MNAEKELIISLLNKAASGANAAEAIGVLLNRPSIDWQRFKSLATHHELVPFIYRGLKDRQSLIPEDLLYFLKNTYYCTLTRNQYLIDESLRIFSEFERLNVPLLPLKGIALLKDIYLDQPVRTMTDIDLLVKPEDLEKAEKIFDSIGYRKELYGAKEEYWKNKESHLPFYKKNPERFSTYIELHFSILADRRTKAMMPDIWRRARRLEDADGKGLWSLSPEDTLIAHALHQRKFGKMLCLKYALDTALILKKYRDTFDWPYLLSQARRSKISASLFFLLWQTKIFLSSSIPQQVEKSLSVPGWKRRLITSVIEKNTFLLPHQAPLKKLYLRCHFLLYDSISQPVCNIINIPQEQFAKFYGMQPYEKEAVFWHRYRFIYIPFAPLLRRLSRAKRPAKESLPKDNLSLYTTSGFSMWPFLKSDEKVLFRPVLAGQLKTGDIILYQDLKPSSSSKDGRLKLVCHRLVGKTKAEKGYDLFVRADNSCGRPEIIPEEKLKGKAVGILRNNKVLSLSGKQRYYINRAIILVAPLVSRLARAAKAFSGPPCKNP